LEVDLSTEEKTNVRKFTWKEKKTFLDYNSADIFRNSLLEEGFNHVKIRRCGPAGIKFKVITGTPVKTNKKENNKNTNKRKEA
jgi:hypothetical protein